MGKPLLAYTLNALRNADLDCPIYVSTDDDAISNIALQYSGVSVIRRPAEFASDTSSTESVLLHVLDNMPDSNHEAEWVMTLPPTSPFRTGKTIRQFAEVIWTKTHTQDCLMSTTENRGDFWQLQEDGSLARLFPNAPRRQQERKPLYEENSAIYVTQISALRKTGSILGNHVRGIPISAIEGFDINTKEDLKMAEYIAAMM